MTTEEIKETASKTCNEKKEIMERLEQECISGGYERGSHYYYAALCGKMEVELLMALSSRNFWEREAAK
jgi:hypothetical protein